MFVDEERAYCVLLLPRSLRIDLVNLSELDLEALTKRFESSTHKRTEIQKLTGLIESRLKHLIKLNHSRMNYLEQFQEMIDEYNSGSRNIEVFIAQLKEFTRNLTEEEQRHVAQGLSEEELAIFDILTKPEPVLTKREEAEVKKVAKTLLQTLKWEKLVLDWRLKQQACAEVQETIAEVFDTLPEVYSKELFDAKRELPTGTSMLHTLALVRASTSVPRNDI